MINGVAARECTVYWKSVHDGFKSTSVYCEPRHTGFLTSRRLGQLLLGLLIPPFSLQNHLPFSPEPLASRGNLPKYAY